MRKRRMAERFQALSILAVLLLPAAAAAQVMVSATGGLVQHVEGEVLINNQPIEAIRATALHVRESQHLRTKQGRAEIMLVPDGYLRLGPQSEIAMVSTGVDSARVRLIEGSAVVDLLEVWDEESVGLLAGDAEVQFLTNGVYRIDAPQGELERVRVFDGKTLVVSGDSEEKVKKKRSLTVAEQGWQVDKFDRSDKDPLEQWSEKRAEAFAAQRAAAQAAAREDRGMSADEMLLKEGSAMWRCRQLGFGCSPDRRDPRQTPRRQPRPQPRQPSPSQKPSGSGGPGR